MICDSPIRRFFYFTDLIENKKEMKKIVAATDFSVNSINAVKYAVDLCLFLKGDLCLIHVSMIPLPIN